ncbi:DUF1361 domain-containing protein [Oscillospiraceae bacterium HV4-5-C5C]|nr:DUF1361 domain-containing protein [Oscillospiraceae bacterium HV4-5-C5C]
MEKLVVTTLLLNLFAILTIRLRPRLFKVKLFRPMVKNFHLSLLPAAAFMLGFLIFLGFSYWAAYSGSKVLTVVATVVLLLGCLGWLLLLPNAGYLITELNMTHRQEDEHEVPIWYDIVSILSFALSGIANTLLNLAALEYAILIIWDPSPLTLGDYWALQGIALLALILVAVGVYLGRAVRFNSWDVLHPGRFWKKC